MVERTRDMLTFAISWLLRKVTERCIVEGFGILYIFSIIGDVLIMFFIVAALAGWNIMEIL